MAALSTALGVVLISAAGYLEAYLRADKVIGAASAAALVLGFLGAVLLGLAVYVAAVVTATTFATVVAGRTRRIAQLRLLGADARSQRAHVARQGLVCGAVGAGLGLLVGIGIAAGGVAVAGSVLDLQVDYAVLRPSLLAPAAIVVPTTWVAAWIGSRGVAIVTPLQALGEVTEPPYGQVLRRPARNGTAGLLLLSGALLLAGGVVLGSTTPYGLVVAFAGGLASFTGLILGSAVLMPPLLRLVGRLVGRSTVARLAAANALRYPQRSSRMTIGVVIGVTLVTTLAVAAASVAGRMAAAWGGPLPPGIQRPLDIFTAVTTGLVAVSAMIAAVGLVNVLTLGVVQRRRELGLLRTLGLTTGQARRMVLLEATHITVTGLLTGLALGVVYGWAGAQSLFGSVRLGPGPTGARVLPALPLGTLAIVVAATAALTLIAAAVAIRPAIRVTPIDSLTP